MPEREPDAARVLRFDLAVQRNHLLVHTLALLTAVAGNALGAFPLRIELALVLWVYACSSAVALLLFYRAGVPRRYLNPVWMANDILLITVGVYATGGAESSAYIWYIAVAGAAAFASGKIAAYLVSAGNTIAYIVLLVLMGQAWFFNDIFVIALGRMIFLFGASYFFLAGVANLQEKRLRIRQLEADGSRKVEELTRLTRELEDANRRTQEADRLKSQFLANMSHELRTPMNSIIGFSEILVERLSGEIDPKHVGFLKHIHASGQHLLSIINDILDLSKIEAGKMEIYPETFPVGPVIESVCHVMRGMSKPSPRFLFEIAPDLPELESDLAKFKQVLFNLLSNAVKFSPAESPITISARKVDDGSGGGAIQVSVRDEGIGIDSSYHQVIFEEFRQVDGTPRREFGGTGLGLALVRKFVELQNGIVSLESAPGRGSTFSFTLPVVSNAAVVSRINDPGPQVDAERVLVIEDDANAYELISSALGSAGYLPLRARHGDEALRMARESSPVAVTLDLVLPGLDGWEVLKRLKGDDSTTQIPVVIISMVDNRELGLALGADDYFVKPVDRDRLLNCLRQITSRSALAGRPRLLVIDDDHSVHTLLGEALGRLGYAMVSAMNGEEGLQAARTDAPDVIILDLMMPGMSGFEVAESLKRHPGTANIPIVVLTSKDISAEERLALHSKVSSFVQKGNSAREQLVREIRRVTARA